MDNTRRLGLSLATGLMLAYMVNAIMWIAQDLITRGQFVFEMTLVWLTTFQLSQLAAPGQLRVRIATLRVEMAGSLDHSHGSTLHWTIALIGGFVLSAIIGQTFTGTVPWNLNNWAVNMPIYGITFVFGVTLIYYLLAR
jgi:hypothetical protein